jgi:hypothetical protein
VRVGVITDRDTISDPETVLADFHDELDLLLAGAAELEPPPSLASRLDRALATLDKILASDVL